MHNFRNGVSKPQVFFPLLLSLCGMKPQLRMKLKRLILGHEADQLVVKDAPAFLHGIRSFSRSLCLIGLLFCNRKDGSAFASQKFMEHNAYFYFKIMPTREER